MSRREYQEKHFADARSKAAELLREARGLEAPPEREPASETRHVVAPEPPPAPQAQPDLEATVERRLKERAALEKAEAQARKVLADAEARHAEAERMATLAKENPAAFLEAQGLTLDDWQARLLNGGEETPEQKWRRTVEERAARAEAEVAKLRAEQTAQSQTQLRQKAIEGMRPGLESEFPLVNRLLGPEGALDHLRTLRMNHEGPDFDIPTALAQMEQHFLNQQRAFLQDSRVAAKLGLNGSSPHSEAVAQGPKTITNRVTSHSGTAAKLDPKDWKAKRELARQILGR